MKKLFFLACFSLAISKANAQSFHGAKFDEKGAISTQELVSQIDGKDSLVTKVQGTVESVCKERGCWMKVKLNDGQSMRVTFKDYGFFVPKDITGKNVVFEGIAKVKTTSVKQLKHYAKDAGKSKEEIAKITEPESTGFCG
ncbi:DUF4920 domain-containing protein [Pseudarcicella hirudinis]|uniref:DUF4920 domain-containing protein n=1 Tax=Pseudarcicella hirudinis TaxID=1079859 RepID=UPI0035EE4CCB